MLPVTTLLLARHNVKPMKKRLFILLLVLAALVLAALAPIIATGE